MGAENHSPAPWGYDEYGCVYDVSRRHIAHLVPGVTKTVKELEQRTINAELIAAAPELLEALKDAIRFFNLDGYSTKRFQEIINRVEGSA